MADTQDIAIVNARLNDPATGREGTGSVLIRDGAIAAVEWQGTPATGEGSTAVATQPAASPASPAAPTTQQPPAAPEITGK